MSIIDDVKTEIGEALTNAGNLVANNPITTAVGAGAVGAAAGVITTAALLSTGTTSSNKKRKSKTKRGRSRDRKFKSKQKHEQRYKRKKKYKVYKRKGYINPKKSKHKKASSRRKGVHYTKKGQPYILLRSGKARFIKKRSKK
jgi:hypothetical protein